MRFSVDQTLLEEDSDLTWAPIMLEYEGLPTLYLRFRRKRGILYTYVMLLGNKGEADKIRFEHLHLGFFKDFGIVWKVLKFYED